MNIVSSELVNDIGQWGTVDDSKCIEATTQTPVTTPNTVTEDLKSLSEQTVTDGSNNLYNIIYTPL